MKDEQPSGPAIALTDMAATGKRYAFVALVAAVAIAAVVFYRYRESVKAAAAKVAEPIAKAAEAVVEPIAKAAG